MWLALDLVAANVADAHTRFAIRETCKLSVHSQRREPCRSCVWIMRDAWTRWLMGLKCNRRLRVASFVKRRLRGDDTPILIS